MNREIAVRNIQSFHRERREEQRTTEKTNKKLANYDIGLFGIVSISCKTNPHPKDDTILCGQNTASNC
jgi:hypothetical protein